MPNKIIILTENDNIFDYLDDEIITVMSALEVIHFNNDEYELSAKNKATILALDSVHYYNDDLFNLLTNEVLTTQDILDKHYIKSFNYDLKNKLKTPKKSSLSIMEVFEYDLKKTA